MRAFVVLPFIFLAMWSLGFADERGVDQVQITLQMVSNELAEERRVFVAGNVAPLGNWRPDVAPMKFTAKHTWTLRFSVPRGTVVEYKYTLGDWSREGARVNGRPLANFKFTAVESTTRTDQILAWTNRKPRANHGQVTGEVRYHRQLASAGLRPRDVVVWLPPSYQSDASRRYPVLYMHDGRNLFDPKTSAFGVDWEVDETLTRLIGANKVGPTIVVGIDHSPDRSQEYLEGDHGARYRDFVVDQLKPLIDATYRTKPEREHTYVGGSSAGGLCAFIMAWEHAETFSRALCMSPAFRVERPDGSVSIDYVTDVLSSPSPQPAPRIYIDNGGRGVDQRLMPGVKAMVEALRSKGFSEEADLRVVIAPDDPHHESAWARRLPTALTWLLD